MTWLTFIEHLCQRLILRIDMFAIVPISSLFPFLLLSTDLAKRRVTRRMSLVGQELPTLPENTCAPPVLSGVRVARSSVFCGVFVHHCWSICFGVLHVLSSLLGSSNRHL